MPLASPVAGEASPRFRRDSLGRSHMLALRLDAQISPSAYSREHDRSTSPATTCRTDRRSTSRRRPRTVMRANGAERAARAPHLTRVTERRGTRVPIRRLGGRDRYLCWVGLGGGQSRCSFRSGAVGGRCQCHCGRRRGRCVERGLSKLDRSLPRQRGVGGRQVPGAGSRTITWICR
jgi:hypothetical protein